jgi:hypothetical protein
MVQQPPPVCRSKDPPPPPPDEDESGQLHYSVTWDGIDTYGTERHLSQSGVAPPDFPLWNFYQDVLLLDGGVTFVIDIHWTSSEQVWINWTWIGPNLYAEGYGNFSADLELPLSIGPCSGDATEPPGQAATIHMWSS